jgi:hypothetical protein
MKSKKFVLFSNSNAHTSPLPYHQETYHPPPPPPQHYTPVSSFPWMQPTPVIYAPQMYAPSPKLVAPPFPVYPGPGGGGGAYGSYPPVMEQPPSPLRQPFKSMWPPMNNYNVRFLPSLPPVSLPPFCILNGLATNNRIWNPRVGPDTLRPHRLYDSPMVLLVSMGPTRTLRNQRVFEDKNMRMICVCDSTTSHLSFFLIFLGGFFFI